MFKTYKHSCNWEESLHVFLYSKLILLKVSVSLLKIDDYLSFELRDIHIKSYNKWVISNQQNKNLIKEWISNNQNHIKYFRDNFNKIYKPKVELWSDRNKTNYYKTKLQTAFEFENYIAKLLQRDYNLDLEQFLTPEGQYSLGENKLGIEIKNDTLINKWGNIYIEYAEKSNSNHDKYIKSGILKNDNSIYFLIGDKDHFWIFRKKRLLEIFREEVQIIKRGHKSTRGIKFKKISTSKGFIFPVKNTSADTISLDQMVKEIKIKHY